MRFVNATVSQYTSSVSGVAADWPALRESDYSRAHNKVSSDRLKLCQGHATGSRDIRNARILFGNPSYYSAIKTQEILK
jgi:hypothetical protein